MGFMSERDFDVLRERVRERYGSSGQPPDVVHALNEHNDRVLEHVEEIARGEGVNGTDYELFKTIAILHDVAKADTPLMLHAHAGSTDAANMLRDIGTKQEFIDAVVHGIECHMGPFPFIDEESRKYTERTGEHLHLPRPESEVEKFFYDADMLALIDIEGIEKVVVLRSTTPEFMEEDERTAASEGGTPRGAAYKSAMQSVTRAADTLFSDTARKIAARLVAEAERHIAQRLTAEATAT
jgi:putative nucleotidyltransferase with HDIG domain